MVTSTKIQEGWAFGTVAKIPLRMPTSHMRAPGFNSSFAANSSFLLLHTLTGSGDGSSTWVAATHMGNLDLVSGSWLQPSKALGHFKQ